jgi:hypothetical protein
MPRALRRSAAILISSLLTLLPAFARQGAGTLGLRIVVVSGDAVENPVDRATTEPFGVVVVDRDNILIPNAQVEFLVPEAGPGGQFEGGQATYQTTTDQTGRALAGRYVANGTAGAYVVRVRAEFGGESATAVIPQTNVRPSGSGRVIAILSAIGAAVGATIAIKGAGGSSPPSTPTPRPTVPAIGLGESSVSPPPR